MDWIEEKWMQKGRGRSLRFIVRRTERPVLGREDWSLSFVYTMNGDCISGGILRPMN